MYSLCILLILQQLSKDCSIVLFIKQIEVAFKIFKILQLRQLQSDALFLRLVRFVGPLILQGGKITYIDISVGSSSDILEDPSSANLRVLCQSVPELQPKNQKMAQNGQKMRFFIFLIFFEWFNLESSYLDNLLYSKRALI